MVIIKQKLCCKGEVEKISCDVDELSLKRVDLRLRSRFRLGFSASAQSNPCRVQVAL